MRQQRERQKAEPTIALINVVFLMLIFFMVVGTLVPPLDKDLKLVNTRDLEGKEPANALIISAGGELRFRNEQVADLTPYLQFLGDDLSVARILPDQNAPASVMVQLARQFQAAGVKRVVIVTEKALR